MNIQYFILFLQLFGKVMHASLQFIYRSFSVDIQPRFHAVFKDGKMKMNEDESEDENDEEETEDDEDKEDDDGDDKDGSEEEDDEESEKEEDEVEENDNGEDNEGLTSVKF